MPQSVPPPAAAPEHPVPLAFRADAVFILDDLVVARPGQLRMRDGEVLELELDEDPPLTTPGAWVLVDVSGEAPARLVTKLEAAEGRTLRLSLQKNARLPDSRDFPRTCGAIPLRWRRLGDSGSPWRSPDPFMNFSATGVRFVGPPEACRAGDILELEVGVGEDPARWPARARVVRVSAAPPEDVEGRDTHHIAVDFLELPIPARDALAAFTLRIQRAMFPTTDPTPA